MVKVFLGQSKKCQIFVETQTMLCQFLDITLFHFKNQSLKHNKVNQKAILQSRRDFEMQKSILEMTLDNKG